MEQRRATRWNSANDMPFPSSRESAEETFDPLSGLALLLHSLNPVAAFKPSAIRARLPARTHRQHLGHSSPVMSASDQVTQSLTRRLAVFSISWALLTGSPGGLLAADTPPGSPVAQEVVQAVQSLSGIDLKQAGQQLQEGGPLTEEQARSKSRKLLASVGDPYTRITAPARAKKRNARYDPSEGFGIDLQPTETGDYFVRSVPLQDSDASRLGMVQGDVVTSINGKSLRGMKDRILWVLQEGDSASLKIKPANGGMEREVTLHRKIQAKNPVKYKIYEANDGSGKTGYIKLKEFNAASRIRMREAVSDLEASGAKRIIIDVRNNVGGIFSTAVGIVGIFADRPLVTYAVTAQGAIPLYSRERALATDVPLQVWVNRQSASASEVLAAALRDNCRASLVGERTYGKGVMQKSTPLSDGGQVWTTFASNVSPAGESYNKKGLQPDIQRTFLSDISMLYVNQDVMATSFGREVATKACQKTSVAKDM